MRGQRQRFKLLEGQKDALLELARDDDTADRTLDRLLAAGQGDTGYERDDEKQQKRGKRGRSSEHGSLPLARGFEPCAAKATVAIARGRVKVSTSAQWVPDGGSGPSRQPRTALFIDLL